jgi:hypothetical protein
VTAASRAPGWHADETDSALLRYWDGSGWTPHTAARTGADAPSAAPAREEPALHRTVRLADAVPDHTTVPTPPITAGVHAVAPQRTASASASAGTLTAAAALVIACAALAIALLG